MLASAVKFNCLEFCLVTSQNKIILIPVTPPHTHTPKSQTLIEVIYQNLSVVLNKILENIESGLVSTHSSLLCAFSHHSVPSQMAFHLSQVLLPSFQKLFTYACLCHLIVNSEGRSERKKKTSIGIPVMSLTSPWEIHIHHLGGQEPS